MPEKTSTRSPRLYSLPEAYCSQVGQSMGGQLYLVNNNKIFAVHRSLLKESVYYQQKFAHESSKFLMVTQNIEDSAVQKILKSLNGSALTFHRDWEILSIFKLLSFLGLTKMKQSVIQDTLKNFSEYGFFVLFNLSVQLEIVELYKACFQELILLGFEQFQYDKHDLFLCDVQTVKKVGEIYNQQYHKCNGQILTRPQITKILKWYCKMNRISQKIQKEIIQTFGSDKLPDKRVSFNESGVSALNKKENVLKSTVSSLNRVSFDIGKGLTAMYESNKLQTIVYSQLDQQSSSQEKQNNISELKSHKSINMYANSQLIPSDKCKNNQNKPRNKRYSCMVSSNTPFHFSKAGLGHLRS